MAFANKIPIKPNITVSTAGSDNGAISVARSDTTCTSLSRSNTTSISLASSPAHKKRRLTTKKSNLNSPGTSTTNESTASSGYGPITSPFRRDTTLQLAGNSMQSPLGNNHKYKSMTTPPSRNWFCSQEQHIDILWDNTSPINPKALKGNQKSLANLQELRKDWGANSHGCESCPSQQSGLSDKWLSIKNDAPNVMYTLIQQRPDSPKNSDQKFRIRKPLIARYPSKELIKILESLGKPNEPEHVHVEESTSDESANEVILPVKKELKQGDPNVSNDELWGEEDNSFLLKTTEILDSELVNPNIILSTLSYENEGIHFSENRYTDINDINTDDDCAVVFQSQTLNKPVVELLSEIEVTKSTSKLSTISSIKKTPSRGKKKMVPLRTDCEAQTDYQDKGDFVDLNEHTKIKATRAYIGLPGVWMSQDLLHSCSSKNSRLPKDSILGPGSSLQHENSSTTFQTKPGRTKPAGAGLPIAHKSTFEMPKCVNLISQDDEISWDIDNEIYSQKNINLFDHIIEQEQSNKSQPLNFRKFRNSQMGQLGDTLANESQSSNQQKDSSQLENSYRRPCSREEINRKRAEAVRRRRKIEQSLKKGTLMPRSSL